MSNRIYVGGLPFSVNEKELSDLFSQYGTVASARVISDKFTGRSRGFGFVEMGTDEEAKKAITGLNGSQLGNRNLIVNEARPQQERRPARSGGFKKHP